MNLFSLGNRFCCGLTLVLLVVLGAARSGASVLVNGQFFDAVDGVWYQIDGNDHRWEVAVGTVLVRFDELADSTTRARFLDVNELTTGRPVPDPKGFYELLYDPDKDPIQLLQVVLADHAVDKAYLDTHLESFGFPDDPYIANQWNVSKARVDRAWRVSGSSQELAIAVIDRDGVELEHEDLSAWVNPDEIADNGEDDDQNGYTDDVSGWDFSTVPGDNDPRPSAPSEVHGTAVAGIAAATTHNGLGVSGVAGGAGSGGARVAAIKVSYFSDLSPAIEYVREQGFDVAVMSFGGIPDPEGAVSAALDGANASGVILVAATGNTGFPFLHFPSSHPAVIAVGSSDVNDQRICKSNYGETMDLVAPSASP